MEAMMAEMKAKKKARSVPRPKEPTPALVVNTEAAVTEAAVTEAAVTEAAVAVPEAQAPEEPSAAAAEDAVETKKEALAKQLPAKQLPAKQLPSKQLPSKQLPTKQSPSKQVPTKEVPSSQISQEVPSSQASQIAAAEQPTANNSTALPSKQLPGKTLAWGQVKSQVQAAAPPMMEGCLMKKGAGKSILGRRNWKERWLVLDKGNITYYNVDKARRRTGAVVKAKPLRSEAAVADPEAAVRIRDAPKGDAPRRQTMEIDLPGEDQGMLILASSDPERDHLQAWRAAFVQHLRFFAGVTTLQNFRSMKAGA